MRPSPMPELSILRSRLIYDKHTGALTWKARTTLDGSRPSEVTRWNKRFAGAKVKTKSKAGYIVVCIDNIQYKSHRICYAMGYLVEPKTFEGLYIDHISGQKDDNRLSNLRLATISENAKNRKISLTNKSGVVGVVKRKRCFEAHVSTKNGRIYLGRFKNIEDASAARKLAEVENNYHANHGREE